MRMRRFRWLGAVVALAVLLGMMLAIPALAAPSKQAKGPEPDAYAAMHEACETGDAQGMTDAMNSLTDEDWATMEEHISDGHHEATGSSMMDTSGMMGRWSETGHGWSGMMGW